MLQTMDVDDNESTQRYPRPSGNNIAPHKFYDFFYLAVALPQVILKNFLNIRTN